MAVLIDSGLRGNVDALLIHRANGDDDITSTATDSAVLSYAGIDGESHSGLTRESCVRVKGQYKEGTEIRNTRQLSIVSTEELATIATLMGISTIEPSWLGASMCVSGIPDFTMLPPSTRLIFSGGVSLVIDMENEPCEYPAKVISKYHPDEGKFFVKHAFGKRGVTAWVEKPGVIDTQESVAVHVPRVRPYLHGKQHRKID